ncbi:DHA2 family efflux MFS transporter permease subunit [Conexibacter stalactiti]|uniref:DHA2 family efflux MFS transporter permease subunit n=1 Tax=Conexibacter stalactiti TaxID=1940611 RepID=A0ABU4HRV3_9ACTN|nr:DHA2 family efflux MFS transporter permease subunit [Conexibacter stalactiti]MDW5596056.1 DHA2 family efflux MFS transporter permease subunit [Conexibacter stalactiti]MEC5036698.1 DHA2 family efflux MFS transporter permease subunit [Conexibacter stalactiti]
MSGPDTPAQSHTAAGEPLPRHVWMVAAVVVLGAVMTILDTTIVNVAIDTLARDFDVSLSTIQWVSTAYLLALATVIPLTGWAADRFGTKRLWMSSVALFVLGSALCGLAWDASSLIAFRILQGIGGGMVMPAGMTVLAQTAGPARVGRVMSIVGVPMLLGPILGPVLGGWLVDDVSWRWIFYVNVPIGLIALPLAWRILDRDVPRPGEKLDLLGLLLLSPGLALFVYGLAETPTRGFGSAGALLPMIAGLVLVVLFVVHSLRSDHPLLDLRLFKVRAFSAAAGVTVLFGSAMFGAMLLFPLYYQIVRGQSALDAGLLMAPQGLGAAVMMPISGRIVDRGAAGKVVLCGLPLVALGYFTYTQLGADTSYALLAGSLFVAGLGTGATMMPSMAAAYQTLSHAAVPRATTTLNILMRVGGSIGTALFAVVLQHQFRDVAPAGGAGAGAAGGESGLGAIAAIPEAARDRVAPALAEAFAHTFWWPVAILLLALIPALFLPRRRPDAPEPAIPPQNPHEAEPTRDSSPATV